MALATKGEEPRKLMDIVEMDDLSTDMKMIAELCGFETAKLLLEKCAGIQIYIPKIEKLPSIVRRYVQERYGTRALTSAELKALSIEVGLSSSYLRREFSNAE